MDKYEKMALRAIHNIDAAHAALQDPRISDGAKKKIRIKLKQIKAELDKHRSD